MLADPSPSPQPPPPLMPLRLVPPHRPCCHYTASLDSATQTGGAKVHWPPPFLQHPHLLTPPPLCRSSHSCGCPHCAPVYLPHPACHPPLHARGHRRDSAPPVPSVGAMPALPPSLHAHMPSLCACW